MRKDVCCFCLPSFTSRFEHESSCVSGRPSCEWYDAVYLFTGAVSRSVRILLSPPSPIFAVCLLADRPFGWDRWNLTTVFVCISLRATDVERFLYRFTNLFGNYLIHLSFIGFVVLHSRY